MSDAMKDQLKRQVGGDHYKRLAIQPMESNIRNRTPWGEGEIIKYVDRWESKNGVQDLEKAAHILDALIAYAKSDEYAARQGVAAPPAKRFIDTARCDIVGCDDSGIHEVPGGLILCLHHEDMRVSDRAGFSQLSFRPQDLGSDVPTWDATVPADLLHCAVRQLSDSESPLMCTIDPCPELAHYRVVGKNLCTPHEQMRKLNEKRFAELSFRTGSQA